jgi:metal-responsive CopG/Arc/MetJ family transcriptional regulator
MAFRSSKSPRAKALSRPRASVSFPRDLYRALEAIAKQKKVSIAWVVREAAEKYVEAQYIAETAAPLSGAASSTR